MGMHGLFGTELEFEHGVMNCSRVSDDAEGRTKHLGLEVTSA